MINVTETKFQPQFQGKQIFERFLSEESCRGRGLCTRFSVQKKRTNSLGFFFFFKSTFVSGCGGLLAQSVERRTLDLRVQGSISSVCTASFTLRKDKSPPLFSLYPGVSGYQFYWRSFQRQTDDDESHLSAKRHGNQRLAPTLWALQLEKDKIKTNFVSM